MNNSARKRSKKGTVTITLSKGKWLQLCFRCNGKRHYLSLGLEAEVLTVKNT